MATDNRPAGHCDSANGFCAGLGFVYAQGKRRRPATGKVASSYSRSAQPKVNRMDVSFIGKKSELLKEDTTEIREKSRKKKIKLGSINEVCIEIDIYIGYELYTEGLEFIVAAKSAYPDESMLDMEHFEILSKAKKCRGVPAFISKARRGTG
ncbi:MAG: hypothetical protein ACI9LO_001665 [Planctomycetota bacterium]|jgi:hypothetical protein